MCNVWFIWIFRSVDLFERSLSRYIKNDNKERDTITSPGPIGEYYKNYLNSLGITSFIKKNFGDDAIQEVEIDGGVCTFSYNNRTIVLGDGSSSIVLYDIDDGKDVRDDMLNVIRCIIGGTININVSDVINLSESYDEPLRDIIKDLGEEYIIAWTRFGAAYLYHRPSDRIIKVASKTIQRYEPMGYGYLETFVASVLRLMGPSGKFDFDITLLPTKLKHLRAFVNELKSNFECLGDVDIEMLPKDDPEVFAHIGEWSILKDGKPVPKKRVLAASSSTSEYHTFLLEILGAITDSESHSKIGDITTAYLLADRPKNADVLKYISVISKHMKHSPDLNFVLWHTTYSISSYLLSK